ncbi:MAG: DUF2191 domain-containing protein [Acidobacteria bacterium]|nr:DUF2191 domain-containing protein [Acidobacteriota bacterium]
MERTTLTLEPDLARALRQRAHDSTRSFKDVVNETLRAGLSVARQPRRRRYRLKAQHLGGVRPGIDLDKALQLAAALEDAEIARKLELRK